MRSPHQFRTLSWPHFRTFVLQVAYLAAICGCAPTSNSLNSADNPPKQGASPERTIGMTDIGKSQTAREALAAGDALFTPQTPEKGLPDYRKALEISHGDGDQVCESEAKSQIARSLWLMDQKPEAREMLAAARKLTSAEDTLSWSRYLGVRGRFEWQDGNLKIASATFSEMYTYCMSHGLHARAIDAAHMMAIVSDAGGQIEWAKRGIAAAEAGDESCKRWLGPLWNNLGWTYDEMQLHDEALDALLKARSAHHRGNNPIAKHVADWSVGHAYRMTKDHTKAVSWLDNALREARTMFADQPEESITNERLAYALWERGELAADLGDHPAALALLEEAMPHLIACGAEEWGPEEIQKLNTRIKTLHSK